MKKILFLGAGSKTDPSFDDTLYMAELWRSQIKVVYPPVIESCHGCYDLMSDYSKQMQSLVEKGDKVVEVLEGGLLFALPSIQATQTTYPIISCPLDFVAYQGFMVPSGNAVVGSVGVEKKVSDVYQTNERKKAVSIARNILDLKEDTVSDPLDEEMQEELNRFGIKISEDSKLMLSYTPEPLHIKEDEVQIWSDSFEDIPTDLRLQMSKYRLSQASNTVQVRGKSNLIYYAAKILSLQRPDIREKLEAMKVEKRNSYGSRGRDLLEELGVNG